MRALAILALALLLTPAARAEFGPYDETGYPVNVLGESTYPGGIPPAGALPAGPVNVVGPLTVYPYYPVLTAEVQRLASEHPDVVKLHSIGKSTLGLDLWMLEIADFARIEKGEGLALEAREVVWVDGGTHSNEYSGVYFAAHLASWLADGYGANETATWIVENRHTWIMPLVNPDGSHVFGRLNAKTVNINRNYPVAWGALEEAPLVNNPGPAPASEVETQHNIEWFNRTQPDLYASIHCCGNLWLYPYGVEGMDPADHGLLSRVCDEAFPTVREDCGPIWSTIYPASGSSVDTVYEYTGAVAFGYEMSGRDAVAVWGQPFTSDAVERQEIESWEGLLHGFLNVERYGAHVVVSDARLAGDSLFVTLRNDGYGNLTRGNLSFTDAAGVLRVAQIPFLAPGESGTLEIAARFEAGALPLDVQYVKRVMREPTRELVVPLQIEKVGLDLVVVGIGEGVSPLGGVEARGVPGAAPVLILAAFACLAFARRR